MDNLVLYEEKEYGVLTLNRPEKRNAISIDMARQLSSLLTEIKDRPIPFLVIKSAGEGVFCSGGDLSELHGELSEQEAYETLGFMKDVLSQIVSLPIPTIALLHGNALGGGCELATACDIRIAREGTKFGFVQSNLGILPGWGGGAILYEKVSPSFALQWLTEGEMHPAGFLLEKGWLHQLVDEVSWNDMDDLLQPYIRKSTKQMRYLKAQFKTAINSDELLDKMDIESRNTASLWASEHHQQVVQSFLNK